MCLMVWRDSCRHNPGWKGLGHYPLFSLTCTKKRGNCQKSEICSSQILTKLTCHSFVGVFGYIKGYCLIHFLDVYGQDKAWNKLRTKFWKKRNGNSSQTLLAQKMLYMSRCFVATCTLLPLGGLTLLGLSAALCLGDVETASFEIFHNSKEIKRFLSFANQNLSCLRRKLPWCSNSWSLRVLLKSLHEIS